LDDLNGDFMGLTVMGNIIVIYHVTMIYPRVNQHRCGKPIGPSRSENHQHSRWVFHIELVVYRDIAPKNRKVGNLDIVEEPSPKTSWKHCSTFYRGLL
jgi:hypothetical protein